MDRWGGSRPLRPPPEDAWQGKRRPRIPYGTILKYSDLILNKYKEDNGIYI